MRSYMCQPTSVCKRLCRNKYNMLVRLKLRLRLCLAVYLHATSQVVADGGRLRQMVVADGGRSVRP